MGDNVFDQPLPAQQFQLSSAIGGVTLTFNKALDDTASNFIYEVECGENGAQPAAGPAAARRRAIVADRLAEGEPDRSGPLLETALDQAAAEQAWSLAEELLRLQLRLELANGGSGERPRQRLRRLATRVDDQFTLLELETDDPRLNPEQRQQLEQELRSPRAPGGHAALGESPNPEAGASGVDDQP